MKTDEDIISRIVWERNVAPFARGGPKITISGNVPRLKPGDKPVGESQTFRYRCPQVYFQAAFRKVQRDIVASYRKHNEGPPMPRVGSQAEAQRLMEGWSPG